MAVVVHAKVATPSIQNFVHSEKNSFSAFAAVSSAAAAVVHAKVKRKGVHSEKNFGAPVGASSAAAVAEAVHAAPKLKAVREGKN